MKVLVAALLALATLALLPATSSAQSLPCQHGVDTFTVYGKGRNLQRIEAAAVMESVYVSEYWDTPCASFVPSGGWPVYLSDAKYIAKQCGWAAAACHDVNKATGEPYAVIGPNLAGFPRAEFFIHEILETLADPYLKNIVGREICDQYNGEWVKIGGIDAPVFALPDGSPFLPPHVPTGGWGLTNQEPW